MFDYTVDAPCDLGASPVWSQLTLQPLSGHVLTPFSLSVIEGAAGRAWFAYYDRLGFNPPARPGFTRRHLGRLYADETLSARLDVEQAGLSALQLRLNGRLAPLAQAEKPGFLASYRLGRSQRKVDELPTALHAELEPTLRKVEAWFRKTRELRWTQAEVLQVMEEIERVATPAMTAFFAARHGLLLAYNRLIVALLGRCPYPHSLALINNSLCDLDGLAEVDMALAVVDLAQQMNPAVLDWVRRGDLGNWQETLPHAGLAEGVTAFLARYGHRTIGEGEMRNPGWWQDPSPLFRALAACHDRSAHPPVKLPSRGGQQKLLELLEPGQRKDAQQTLGQIRRLLALQSRSLDALAYVFAGTRLWALAAAKEAMVDGRLVDPDDVFFFEIEEMKEMMTGEWNVSDRAGIQATAAQRRTEYASWCKAWPGDLWVGDQEARSVQPGLPAVAGHITGPLRRVAGPQTQRCAAAVVGVDQMDAGCALALPLAGAFVAASGTPVDAIAAAARYWHTPAVVGLGAAFGRLVEGAQTTVDGDTGAVDQ